MPLRTWDVGVREGRLWRQGQEAALEGSGERVRPHWHRAHWHRYWTGPRDADDRGLVVKCVAPVLVNARLKPAEDDLQAVRRKVRM